MKKVKNKLIYKITNPFWSTKLDNKNKIKLINSLGIMKTKQI